ncbi:MAG: hypothetical protein AABX51_03160 [Nanoarchaeota archaeon]
MLESRLDGIEPILTGTKPPKNRAIGYKYLLFEVSLEKGGESYTANYLRGFEKEYILHSIIGHGFCEELGDSFPEFNIPKRWPNNPRDDRRQIRDLVFEQDGLKLVVSGIGGGKYDLNNGSIIIHGKSEGFGPIPDNYVDKLRDLLEQLIQKPAFEGYQVAIN